MVKTTYKIFAVSLFFCISFWVIDTALGHFIFNKGTFLDLLILKIPQHALYIRILILIFFFLFGIFFSRTISKRKKTEGELRKSEERLREVLEHSLDALYKRNLKTGKYEYMSPAIVQISGYTTNELLDMEPEEIETLIHPDDLGKINKLKKTIYETPQDQEIPSELEYRIKHKDGTYRWISDHFKLIRDDDGQPAFTVASVRDITEQKRTEKIMQEREKIARTLINAPSDSVFLIDNTGIILELNETAAAYIGKSKDELQGLNIFDLFSPEVKKRRKNWVKEVILEKNPIRVEDERDGIWFDTICYPILDESGDVSRLAFFSRNITERKKAEEELYQYEQIVSSSTDMMALLDKQFKYIAANKAYLEAFDLPSSKMVGQTVSDIFGEKFFKTIIKPHAEKCLSGEKVNYQDWFEFPALGKRYMDITYSQYLGVDNEVKGFVVSARNITERKKAEEQLEKSQEELKRLAAHLQTAREEERTLVAHELHDDIGQALAALKMDIFMLEKKLPKDQKDISDQIKETKDLLDKTIQTTKKIYTELRPTLIEHFSIKEVLEDQLINFRKSNNLSGITDIDLKGIELKEEDSITIYRIVQETLNNVKWHSNAKSVNIKLKKTKNLLELTIEDDGIGIKEEDLNKPDSFGIIGMRERASFLGGEIEFKGLPEKGTTVTVTFPINPKQ